ncbi:MAG: hypothetical protein ACOX77_10415, partial [Caldicoprobacterales bacterium]
TQVTVSFLEEPDFDSIGEQDVGIVLEDAGRNRTVYTAKLYIDQLIKVKPFFKIVLKVFLDEPALLYKKGMANKPSTCRKLT